MRLRLLSIAPRLVLVTVVVVTVARAALAAAAVPVAFHIAFIRLTVIMYALVV